MKTEILSSAIEHIDDPFITEAANYRPHPAVRSAATFRRLIALTAAAVLCHCAALPALAAADVDGAYLLLYAISPALAQQMKPLNLSCEDNGIRMDVLSADVSDDFPIAANLDSDTAHICIALTDLTGERIDATTDLFDSYFIRSPFDSAAIYCASYCPCMVSTSRLSCAPVVSQMRQPSRSMATGLLSSCAPRWDAPSTHGANGLPPAA